MKKPLLLVPIFAFAVLAGVVSLGEAAPAPHETVLDSVEAVRDNDVRQLLDVIMTPAELRELEANWNTERTREVEPSEEFGFNVALQMFISPGAEETLMAQVEPELAGFQEQAGMIAALATGMAQAQIDGQESLDAGQREDAQRFLEGFAEMLQDDGLLDPARARQAIGVLCSAVRETGVESFADLRALEFDELLTACGPLMGALKEVLVVYGVDMNSWLDSVNARTVQESEGKATVVVEFDWMGATEETTAELQWFDGKWISKR